MTTTDRLIEISRQTLKALLAEYQATSNRDDALHALSALKEIEKIGPLKGAVSEELNLCPSCGAPPGYWKPGCHNKLHGIRSAVPWHPEIQGVPI